MTFFRLLTLMLVTVGACAAPAAAQDYPLPGPPNASVVANPPNAFIGQLVVFDGSGSRDPDGGPLTYRWDSDNNGTFEIDTDTDPRLPFTSFVTGPNTVRMEARDPGSQTDVATATATFFPRPGIVVDRTPPTVRLSRISRSLRRALRSGVAVRLRCSEGCIMASTIGVNSRTGRALGLRGRQRTLGRAFGAVTSAGSRRLNFKLSRTARRELRTVKRVRVTLQFKVRDPAGNQRTVRRTIVLRR